MVCQHFKRKDIFSILVLSFFLQLITQFCIAKKNEKNKDLA